MLRAPRRCAMQLYTYKAIKHWTAGARPRWPRCATTWAEASPEWRSLSATVVSCTSNTTVSIASCLTRNAAQKTADGKSRVQRYPGTTSDNPCLLCNYWRYNNCSAAELSITRVDYTISPAAQMHPHLGSVQKLHVKMHGHSCIPNNCDKAGRQNCQP